MRILKKILLITLIANTSAFGLGGESITSLQGYMAPSTRAWNIGGAKFYTSNTTEEHLRNSANVSSHFTGTANRSYSWADGIEYSESKLEYSNNSAYKTTLLTDMENLINYGIDHDKASFRKESSFNTKAQKEDFLRSLLVKKLAYLDDIKERGDFDLHPMFRRRKQTLAIGDLFLTFAKDQMALFQLSETADRIFWNYRSEDRLDWLEKALMYGKELLKMNPSRLQRVCFLQKYECLDSFSHIYAQAMDLERKLYPQAIEIANYLYGADPEGTHKQSEYVYQIRQIFSKASLYEKSPKKRQEYEHKLSLLPYQDIPYKVAGKEIVCTPQEIARIQRERGLAFRFNKNGTILNIEEGQIFSQDITLKKELTPEQEEKKKERRKRYLERKKQKKREPQAIELQERELQQDIEITEIEQMTTPPTIEPEQVETSPETAVLKEKLEIQDLPEDNQLKIDQSSILDESGTFAPEQEDADEDADYLKIIAQEKARSAAKKAGSLKEKVAAQEEIIQVSGENIWVIRQAYHGQPSEIQKVHAILTEIDSLSNRLLKKKEAQSYLERLSFLLGIKGETSPNLVKILGIPFGYHEVHGSHGNDWTIDMVKRFKTFAVQIRSVFDHIIR